MMDFDPKIEASFQSYMPDGGDLRKNMASSTEKKIKLPKTLDVPVASKTNNVATSISVQTNQAATRLLNESGQTKIAKRVEKLNKEEQLARQLTKEKKAAVAKTQKKAERTKKVPPLPPVPSLLKEPVLHEAPLPEQMPDTLHIQTMERHNRRHQHLELFATQIERPDRVTTDMITQIPPLVQTLQYGNRLEQMQVCYEQYKNTLANAPHLRFQKPPVFTRSVLQPFLRVPDPRFPHERVCCNLDRDPVAGEGRIRCAAHMLSEEQLGQGFRLRELLYPEQIVAINHTLEVEGGDASKHLYPIHEMCYLCHIYFTTQMAFSQKDKDEERTNQDLTRDTRKEMCAILNRFIVTIGTEGEYDPRVMLVSDNVGMGVFGPFPQWHPKNYVCTTVMPSGLKGIAETDNMVFRLSREPSEQIEPFTMKGSNRSTPTNAKRGTMNLFQ